MRPPGWRFFSSPAFPEQEYFLFGLDTKLPCCLLYILETNLARFYFVLSVVVEKFCGPKLPATGCWKISKQISLLLQTWKPVLQVRFLQSCNVVYISDFWRCRLLDSTSRFSGSCLYIYHTNPWFFKSPQ